MGATSTTPILDLLAPLPEPRLDDFRLPKYSPLIAIFLAAAVFREYEVLIVVFGFLFIALVATAIHEFGHVAAGHRLGFRFDSVGIGPIWVRHESEKWTVELRRHLISGLTYMSLDRIYRVRKRLTLYVAAGPAAGFLSGVMALIGWRIAVDHDYAFLALILFTFGSYSLYINCLSLWPARFGRYPSDGMLLRALFGSKESTKQLIAQHALKIQKRNGIDPFCLNTRWLQIANSENGIGDTRYRAYVAHWNSYQNEANTDAAAQFLEKCLAGSTFLDAENRDVLILEASIFSALRREDSVKADVWFRRAVYPNQIHPLVLARARAALSLVHRRFDDALEHIDKGLETIHQLSASGKARQLEITLLDWRRDIENRRDTGSSDSQVVAASKICD